MECAGWNFVLGRWDFILVGGILVGFFFKD